MKDSKKMKEFEVCAYPWATQTGKILVPEDTKDIKQYICENFNKVKFEEPSLEYDNIEFEFYEE